MSVAPGGEGDVFALACQCREQVLEGSFIEGSFVFVSYYH